MNKLDMIINKLKVIIGMFLPPIIKNLFKQKIWVGSYSNWKDLKLKSIGYDNLDILEKCKNSLMDVVSGKAVYERDSVLFTEIQYSWGLLSGLQYAAISNDNSLNIVDFGGSLGSTYYQNRNFLNHLKNINWAIVEQKHFVDCGNNFFSTDIITFHNCIKDIPNLEKYNVLLLSGVLQYLEAPRKEILDFLKYEFQYIIIDRTSFTSNETRDILTIQNVPKEIYLANYPCWFFAKDFLEEILSDYENIGQFSSNFEPDSIVLSNGEIGTWRGFIFRRKKLCLN